MNVPKPQPPKQKFVSILEAKAAEAQAKKNRPKRNRTHTSKRRTS